MTRHLRSIEYEPASGPSAYERWERGDDEYVRAPLAVADPAYRAVVVRLLAPWQRAGARLIGVGSGNGFAEADLAAAGWDVLATDRAESALTLCREKGLPAVGFDLMADEPPGAFDAIYCDGVFGHLWRPGTRCAAAWERLAALGRAGATCLVSNDLADDDDAPCFVVRADAEASFYRPPRGWFVQDARATGRWDPVSESVYRYERSGASRRREIIVARLLLNERVEAEDLT